MARFHPTAKELLPGHVHVWTSCLDDLEDPTAQCLEVLSADERERARRLHGTDGHQRFVRGRATLRALLASYLAVPPDSIGFRYNAYGKPGLERQRQGTLSFNLAHSRACAIYAVTREAAIGVDVEYRRPSPFQPMRIARRFFSAAEQARLAALPEHRRGPEFFQVWARKEALVKAMGVGLFSRLRETPVPDGWTVCDLNTIPGYATALAVQSRQVAISYGCLSASLAGIADCVCRAVDGSGSSDSRFQPAAGGQ